MPDLKGLILKLMEDSALVGLVVPSFLHLGGTSPGAPEDVEGDW